ncbi:DUF2167 domain-containing protein [Paenibacillus sp. TH7-28]
MKKHMYRPKISIFLIAFMMVISTFAVPVSISAEEVEQTEDEVQLNWIEGKGQLVPLGSIAQLKLPENYVFLNKDDTIALLESTQQLPTYEEIGYIEPLAEDQLWSVYFEYNESGHISDDDKTEIDADALLESYEAGQKEANKELSPENQLTVKGWFAPPKYDEQLRSLTWALLLQDHQGQDIINYNVRILTREGNISVILVSDPANLDADRKVMEAEILPVLTVNAGQAYNDYDPATDKKSSAGLTGLILGGAGLAVAKKAGLLSIIVVLLKKFWFLIIVPFAWVLNLFRGKKGKAKKGNPGNPEPSSEERNEPPASV